MSTPLHYLAHLARMGATNLHPGGREATEWLLRCLDLRDGQRVLEVGCGTGETIVRVLLRRRVRLDGVDVLPEMLRLARVRLWLAGGRGTCRLYRAEPGAPLPFTDASYDRAYTESVLGFQRTDAVRAMLADILRVLKPGGLFVANEAIWLPHVRDETVRAINESCLQDFGLPVASERAWSVDDWLALMRDAGFQIVSAQTLEEHAAQAGEANHGLDPRLLLSAALTLGYRAKGRLDPRTLRLRAAYQPLLRKQRFDGDCLEARLFVLRRP